MIRRILPGPSPEERDFDQFIDQLAADPATTRQSASTDLERFAVWVRDSAQAPPAQSQEPDPLLERLLAEQRRATLDPPREHQATVTPSPERPAPLETRSLPVERSPMLTMIEDPPRQIGWARVPSYLAAAVVLCLVSVTAYAILSSDGSNRPSNGGSANLASTSLAAAPTIDDPQPQVTVDGVDIVIVSWELTSTIDTAFADEPPRRGAFLVLQATLTNTRAVANRDAPFKILAVTDENDETFEIDKYGTVLANDTVDGAESLSNILLEAGVEHVVYFVFDVPDTSHRFALTDVNGSFTLPVVEP